MHTIKIAKVAQLTQYQNGLVEDTDLTLDLDPGTFSSGKQYGIQFGWSILYFDTNRCFICSLFFALDSLPIISMCCCQCYLNLRGIISGLAVTSFCTIFKFYDYIRSCYFLRPIDKSNFTQYVIECGDLILLPLSSMSFPCIMLFSYPIFYSVFWDLSCRSIYLFFCSLFNSNYLRRRRWLVFELLELQMVASRCWCLTRWFYKSKTDIKRKSLVVPFIIIMDVIYHAYCLDGCFSALAVYTYLNLLHNYVGGSPADLFTQLIKSSKHKNLRKEELKQVKCPKIEKEVPQELPEEFFIYDKINRFFSINPGRCNQVIPFMSSIKGKKQFALLVDCYGDNADNLTILAKSYKQVFVIDHHTTAPQSLQFVSKTYQNISFYFGQDKCGFELVLEFLRYLDFQAICPPKLFKYLHETSNYVRKNDLKEAETIQSKCYTIGFFDMGLTLNNQNPLLFKRLAMIDIQQLITRGKNILPNHLKQLASLMKGLKLISYQKQKFLGLEVPNCNHVSDLGLILLRHGLNKGLANLAMFYRHQTYDNTYRVSMRSLRQGNNPLALKMAENFGGGGHLYAAGCKIGIGKFKSVFNLTPYPKFEFDQKSLLGE